MLRCVFLLASLFLVFSCHSFQPQPIPDAAGEIPETFALYTEVPATTAPWWDAFGSEELTRLIDDALQGSFSLKEAYARLVQVRSMAVQAGAGRYPEVSATGSARAERTRSETTTSGSVGRQIFGLGLTGSYELDLWGRVRSQKEAALLDAEASKEDLYTATITVTAEVADRWIRIISRQRQKLLLEKQLQNNLTFLELIELRFRKAMVSALDVYQQKQTVENVRARIPLVEAETQVLLHDLALLLGRAPRSDLGLKEDTLPYIGMLPPIGLPGDLLANRPDVRSAGIRLESTRWQVAEARANRLPAIRLTAGAQYGGGDFDLLFDTWVVNLAANLTAPLFDGGRRAAEVDKRRAMAQENLWAYRRTIMTAIKEVEDALVNETRQREHIQGLIAVREAAQRGFEEAAQRYRNGLIDYLPVLTQLLAVQELDRNLIDQQAKLILFRIGLHRALGGSRING